MLITILVTQSMVQPVWPHVSYDHIAMIQRMMHPRRHR